MRTVTWDEVYARRLRASALSERSAAGDAVGVARAICGAHAQLETGAELALSARVEGVTRAVVRELLWASRSLVKANTLRTTLHLHPADELALWKVRQVLVERWREQWWLDERGMTLAEMEALRERVLVLLDDGEPRTRVEIAAALGGAAGAQLAEDSWGHLLAPVSDLLCQGPPRGRNVTLVRCDRWIDGWSPPEPAAALREICRRYLETYGPARRAELEHWLAMRLPDDAFDGFEEIDVEGYRTFVLPGTTFDAGAPAGVRLLWHYDPYVIGCHPRDHLIPDEKRRIFLRGAGPAPTLLVAGRVAGTWTRTLRGRRMEIRVEPFHHLRPAEERDLRRDAARVAATYDADPSLSVV
ncbi:MAG TPA: winged helix DNA-binding domain-containing protein [Gaiellaceae bacterium]|jgi:hypothetical protein|nr:winged helix DNA-binding domain-containing protein [Gaiellaceae bacterium]